MSGVRADTCRAIAPQQNSWWGALALALAVCGGLLVAGLSAAPLAGQEADEVDVELEQGEALAEVIVEGNSSILLEDIQKHIRIRAGRVVRPEQIKKDIEALYATRWFATVEAKIRRTEQGSVLVFRVVERPILQRVEFKGNKKIKTKDLTGLTGLVKGGAYDVSLNKEAQRRVEAHYHEKGFVHAKVELEKGAARTDREVVFAITEGPKVKVGWVSFTGNKFVGDEMLKLKVRSKSRIIGLFGGQFDPANVPEDVAGVKDYYTGLGFFDVKVTPKQTESKDKSLVYLEYNIEEGLRYKVREIIVSGNNVLSDKELLKEASLRPGAYFREMDLSKDINRMNGEYGKQGRIFSKVNASPRFLEEPGTVDIVFNIHEDMVRRIGKVNVTIKGDHPHTKQSVVKNMSRLNPGDLADPALIKRAENYLGGSVFAQGGPGDADSPKVTVSQPPTDLKLVSTSMREPNEQIIRAQGVADPNNPQLMNPNNPQLMDPNNPGVYPQEGYVDRVLQDPTVDLDIQVTETQTGRLMFGAGFNSDIGVVGSFVLEEKNFDITRVPTSLQDFVDGTAFRGGGQQFRLEAVPGSQVSRYLFSFREPYLLDSDISLGVSGFYYTRLFPDWNERRAGGRVSLGRQFSNTVSGSLALRLEDVDISSPTTPTPKILQDNLGTSMLSTIRAGVSHDTRDRAFMPGRGHFAEVAYEQGVGEFVYPRAEVSGQQYFTLAERPDGSGRQILTLLGNVNYTGENTPIYERYFAGGFQSFRGFAFRGVSPTDQGVAIGGRWMATGTAEYMVPVTANDQFQLVAFTDFGTVENDVGFQDFRVSVGGGVRLTVSALGPAPIALDWAVPVVREDFDKTRLFSFYFGFLR